MKPHADTPLDDRERQVDRHELDQRSAHLRAVLQVEDAGIDTFVGQCPEQSFDRVYGGQLAAQALLAAARTVGAGLTPISAHTTFLKIGGVGREIRYEIERAHDGRSLSSRVSHAYQGDRLLAVSIISFQHAGTEHDAIDHDPLLRPAESPESLPDRQSAMRQHFGDDITHTMAMSSWPVEVRYLDRAPWTDERSEPRNRMWMRSAVALDDDPLTHRAALLYAADLHLFEPILFPAALRWVDLVNARGAFGASLDYTLYFHRDFRFDQWLLHEQEAEAMANSRGLTTGRFWTRDGALAASVTELVGIFTVPPS